MKHFLLVQYICMATGDVIENAPLKHEATLAKKFLMALEPRALDQNTAQPRQSAYRVTEKWKKNSHSWKISPNFFEKTHCPRVDFSRE